MNLVNARTEKLPLGRNMAVGVWLTGICFLIPAFYLFTNGQMRILIAFMFFTALSMSWILNRTMGIAATFIFLLVLGDLRRILDMIAPSYQGLDLLLIVGPVFALVLAVPLFMNLKVADTLSKAVLALMALMILEVFNPKQGSIIVGAGGALFYVIPIFWFWIARNYATDQMMFLLIYRVFLPLGVLDALLGVVQTYIGFFPWELDWVTRLGTQYELAAGHYRSFGFSTGSPEFASTLLISSVILVAAIFAGRRAYALLLPILLIASILASARGTIVKLVFAAAMIWAVRNKGGRNWLPRLIFALVVGFGLTYYSASHASAGDSPSLSNRASTAEAATDHVVKGLADPGHSTAGLHWQIFVLGIEKGFSYPIGYGIGAVTLASGKFTAGGATMGSSEIDISDAFTTMGFFGGFLYLFIIYLVFRLAFFYIRQAPLIMSLAYMGLFAAMVGGWIALGQYSTAPFIWFCIGSLVRKQSLLKSAGFQPDDSDTKTLKRVAPSRI